MITLAFVLPDRSRDYCATHLPVSFQVREAPSPPERSPEDRIPGQNCQPAGESEAVTARQDSETFSDSLEKPRAEKSSLFREVRRNFHRKIAEKITQNLAGYKIISGSRLFQNFQLAAQQEEAAPSFAVWNCPEQPPPGKSPKDEMHFFDSIDNSLDIDKDDSLLINSCSYYREPSVQHEAMADLDSLEVVAGNCPRPE